MHTGKPAHLRSFDYTGFHRYSLTFCTANRRRIFVTSAAVEPDHLHLLIQGESEAAECRRFISASRQYSGFYYSKAFKSVLWQRYGFERTLRREEDTLVVARYILGNPIRAGLVEKVEDYPFSGSLIYALSDLLASVCEQP